VGYRSQKRRCGSSRAMRALDSGRNEGVTSALSPDEWRLATMDNCSASVARRQIAALRQRVHRRGSRDLPQAWLAPPQLDPFLP
jgi:hypothetical protein